MTMPESTAALNDLIAALGEIRDGYCLDPERFTTELERAEGFRYVGQVLSAASELFIEGDPDHPRFVSIVDPGRKLQGDNPDAIYHFARISGEHGYKVSGTIEQQCYTSFTVHGVAPDGGMAGPLLGDVNDRDFEVGADGFYEVVFSAEEQPGNWVRLDPAAHSLVVRSYYQLEKSAQNNADIAVRIDIETTDEVAPPAPLDDATIAARMREAVAFVRQATVHQNPPGTGSAVPFVSNVPNELPVPFSFRDSGLPVPGAADIFYSMGRFALADDEALVMEGTLPPGPFANVMLWNVHMQTLDYRSRQSALNADQITNEADGTYRIVVSATDPGTKNWLDTGGHTRGSIFWRFLLPETDPPQPICTVVKVADL